MQPEVLSLACRRRMLAGSGVSCACPLCRFSLSQAHSFICARVCGICSLLTCPCIHTCPCLSRWGLFLLGSAWVIMPITEPGRERMAFVDWLVPGSYPTPPLGIRRAPPKPRGLRNGGQGDPRQTCRFLLSKGSEPLFQVHVFLPKIQYLRA